MLNRRALFAALAAPMASASVAHATATEAIPDAGAIRVWAVTGPALASRVTGQSIDHPESIARARQSFERLLGRLPYRFRSAATGEVVTVPDLGATGQPILITSSGQLLR